MPLAMSPELHYTEQLNDLPTGAFTGFFVGWPDPPTPERHRELLARSYAVWLAVAGDRCVGFINALSDGVWYAHIPLLEVLPAWRGRGIGSELVRRMLKSLEHCYAIDVVCDEALASFYARHGLQRRTAMVRRNYAAQNGSSSDARGGT